MDLATMIFSFLGKEADLGAKLYATAKEAPDAARAALEQLDAAVTAADNALDVAIARNNAAVDAELAASKK